MVGSLQAGKQSSGVGAWKVSQRVAPLFETLEDLDNAGKVMRHLFSVRWYREQLRYCKRFFTCSFYSAVVFGMPLAGIASKGSPDLFVLGGRHEGLCP